MGGFQYWDLAQPGETLDPATGQCVYRSWAWLGNTIQRDNGEKWVVSDFETGVNGGLKEYSWQKAFLDWFVRLTEYIFYISVDFLWMEFFK